MAHVQNGMDGANAARFRLVMRHIYDELRS